MQADEVRHDLEDYRWLVSTEAAPWLVEADALSADPQRRAARLRRGVGPQRAALLAETADLRRRATAKFSRGGSMFFTRDGLQQASDERIARYKASQFPAGAAVDDLCSGIGGDALALAQRGPVRAIDIQPALALIATANAAVCGVAENMQAVAADVTSLSLAAKLLHVDPGRRAHGRKVARRVDLYEPPLEVLLPLLRQAAGACVKLAPAADMTDQLRQQTQLEWISHRGECRQLVQWWSGLARRPAWRTATCLGADGQVVGQFHAPMQAALPAAVAERIGSFLYEPDPAVLAAALTDDLAHAYGLRRVAPGIAYLTRDSERIDCPLLTAFEVHDVMPFDRKRLKAYVRHHAIGRLEIKKRGVQIDPQVLQQKLSNPGDRMATLILFPTPRGTMAAVGKRIGMD